MDKIKAKIPGLQPYPHPVSFRISQSLYDVLSSSKSENETLSDVLHRHLWRGLVSEADMGDLPPETEDLMSNHTYRMRIAEEYESVGNNISLSEKEKEAQRSLMIEIARGVV